MFISRLKEFRAEKVRVPAFFEEDLEAIAKKLGYYEALVHGEVKCFICGKQVSLQNVGAFIKTGDGIKVVCDSTICLFKAIRIAEELKRGA